MTNSHSHHHISRFSARAAQYWIGEKQSHGDLKNHSRSDSQGSLASMSSAAAAANALKFDSIEDTIQAFKRGEFIVVLDSQDRENEGDLIIAAEAVTTEKMAFMIRHTSGLICTPLPASHTTRLSLPQMVVDNTESHRTAYTVSVDASCHTLTTGISAHDRAQTCRTLASPTATPSSFRRPGHVFPLRAREGGVRVRTGHTEAAVDFCNLAGLQPVGVICELVESGEEVEGMAVMAGDVGMMRRDGCLAFGKKWGLKVCTIEDLVKYRERTEGPLDDSLLNGENVDGETLNGEVKSVV